MRLGVIVVGLRLCALLVQSIAVAGLAASGGRLRSLLVGTSYVLGESLLFIGLALIAWKGLGARLGIPLAVALTLAFPLAFLASVVDTVVYSVTGDHLTPSVL